MQVGVRGAVTGRYLCWKVATRRGRGVVSGNLDGWHEIPSRREP